MEEVLKEYVEQGRAAGPPVEELHRGGRPAAIPGKAEREEPACHAVGRKRAARPEPLFDEELRPCRLKCAKALRNFLAAQF